MGIALSPVSKQNFASHMCQLYPMTYISVVMQYQMLQVAANVLDRLFDASEHPSASFQVGNRIFSKHKPARPVCSL